MSYSSSKQVSHMASLYESIYSQVLTEEQEIKLSIIECYNALVNEGIIDGDLIQNNIALDEGKTTEIFKLVGKGLKQATGIMTRPTTEVGRKVRAVQQATVLPGAVAAGANIGGVRDRTGAALGAFVADPNKRKKFADSFDVFDAIKGHLLDEGYADTEDAALKIMANMSEEWRESIVEGLVGALAKGASVAARAVKNAPKAVDNAMKYYEKNPAAAAPFLAPAIAASGINAKKQQPKGNVPRGTVVK